MRPILPGLPDVLAFANDQAMRTNPMKVRSHSWMVPSKVSRRQGRPPFGDLSRPVSAIMTAVVSTCSKSDSVDSLTRLMTENRVRHVPVVEDGKLIGIVSIGDVVKTRMEELETEHQQLQSYITQG
jgi:CBS domain-containing protein